MLRHQIKEQQSKREYTNILPLQTPQTSSVVCESVFNISRNQMLTGQILKELGYGITWLFS